MKLFISESLAYESPNTLRKGGIVLIEKRQCWQANSNAATLLPRIFKTIFFWLFSKLIDQFPQNKRLPKLRLHPSNPPSQPTRIAFIYLPFLLRQQEQWAQS